MMTWALLVVVLMTTLLGRAAAEPLDVAVEPYRGAARSGALGTVAGQAVEEGGRPGEPHRPLDALAVTLVPRSPALLAKFDGIRRRARAGDRAYRTSAPALVEARRVYERALSDAGAGELVRFTAGGPDGTFEVAGLPAGQWLLIAERAVFVERPGPAPSKREREIYVPTPRLKGYYTVTVWLRELTVAAGRMEHVELNDRNAWMIAISEDRRDTGAKPAPRR